MVFGGLLKSHYSFLFFSLNFVIQLQRRQAILCLCFCAHVYISYICMRMCDISRCISRTWNQLVAVYITAGAVLYTLLHVQCCMNNGGGGKKRVFFRQLNSWSCKYATRAVLYPAESNPLHWGFAVAERLCLCGSQITRYFGEGTTQVKTNLKRGFLEVFILKWQKGSKVELGCSV